MCCSQATINDPKRWCFYNKSRKRKEIDLDGTEVPQKEVKVSVFGFKVEFHLDRTDWKYRRQEESSNERKK